MKKYLGMVAAMVLCLMMVVPAFAATTGSGTLSKSNTPSSGFDYTAPDDPADIFGVEDVSVDDVADKLNAKGNDVVNIIQVVGRWVCIGCAILGIVLCVAGAIGNSRLIFKGFIALIIGAVGYAGVTCGREIVQFIASWAAS